MSIELFTVWLHCGLDEGISENSSQGQCDNVDEIMVPQDSQILPLFLMLF